MSEQALLCWLYVAHVTKRPLADLITQALLDAYDLSGESAIAAAELRDEWLEAHPGATEKDYRKVQRRRDDERYNRKSFKTRVRKGSPSGTDWIRDMGISLA